MKKKHAIAFLFLLSSMLIHAQGVVFSKYRAILNVDEIQTIQVCNPTTVTRAFQLAFMDRKMEEGGRLTAMPDDTPFPQSLIKQLRVYPKRITLTSGRCQTVQIQLKSTGNLSEGEYRSYLHFLPLTDFGTEQIDDSTQTSIVPLIAMRIGAAIPLIYRKHTQLGRVSLDSVQLTKNEVGARLVSMNLCREGTQSCYGTIRITGWVKSKPTTVVEMPGNAIYAEAGRRTFVISLGNMELDTDTSGKIAVLIQYINQEEDTPKKVLAEWSGAL